MKVTYKKFCFLKPHTAVPPVSSHVQMSSYAEFALKQAAIDFLKTLPPSSKTQLFARDKGDADNPGSQVFIVSTPKQIYQRSVSPLINNSPANFYEWMGPQQKCNGDDGVKLALDLDMEGVEASRPFNEDILWVVNHVSLALSCAFHVDVPTSLWIALKTDYDPLKCKHSAHLVLDGFKFANTDARKTFLGNLNLVAKFAERCQEAQSPLKVVDATVFGKKMFRLYKSTKARKNLPLWAANLEGLMEPGNGLQFFLKTMATYTDNCQLLEMPESSVTRNPTHRSQVRASPSENQVQDSSSKTLSERGQLFSRMLRLIDVKKWVKYDDWLSIGMNLKTLGLPGDEGRRIFEEVSKEFPGFEGSCVSKRWDGFVIKENTVDKAENILKSWAQKSNPELFKGLMAELPPVVPPDRTYTAVKHEFEKEWFKCLNPPVFVNIDGDEIFFRKKSELKHIAELLTFEDIKESTTGNKTVHNSNFLDRWLKDPAQRTYKRIDFLPPPLVSPADTFNTFRGFAAEKLPPNPPGYIFDITPIDDLLYSLCDQQIEAKEYLLSWLAHIIQYPATLPRTGIVMKSKQGRGKNMLFGTLFGEKILGTALYNSSARADNFFGKFANGFVNRLLCNFNEVEIKDIQNLMGAVKEAITEPVLNYEKKGVDVIKIRNCARQLWFTNNDIPLKISMDDRRWVAVQASNSMPETGTSAHRAFFKSIKDWIDLDENVRGFYDFLKSRDISAWNPDDRPNTSFYTDLKQLSLDRLDQWLVDQIEASTLPSIILSRKLAKLLMRNDRDIIQPNSVTNQLRKYEGKGVTIPTHQRWVDKEKGRAIIFEKRLLQEAFSELGLLQSQFLPDSDEEDP